MKVMLWTVFAFALSGICYAAGGGGAHHEPSIKDLIWPAFNFILLFGFIGWKMRKPVSQGFTQKSEDIAELYDFAGKRIKEAEEIYKKSSEKAGSLEVHVIEIKTKADQEIVDFETKQKEDTETTITKMKSDCATRIEHEKNQMVKQANADLIDEVINKTKVSIGGDSATKNKVTEKLLAGLQ